MEHVAKFEKVSYEQFEAAVLKYNGFVNVSFIRDVYDAIKLPTRATSGSAGYDFYIPFTTELGKTAVVIPTGIRCMIVDGWHLSLLPKSGLGFKFGTRLENTVGVIDADYYRSDNEGHIMAKMTSTKPCDLISGEKFMQGIFLPYGITVDDDASGTRNGGFGSTGK